MRKRLDMVENSIIKVLLTVLLGFGVGFLINHVWVHGIEAISMGILLFLIHLLGKRIDDDDDD